MRFLYLLLLIFSTSNGLVAQGFRLPTPEVFRLKNGLTVLLTEQHEVPLVSISCMLPGGSIRDGEHPGLSRMTALGLMHGTTSRTKKQINEALDFLGASIFASAYKEYAYLSAQSAAIDAPTLLPLLADILQQPTFDSIEFEKERKRVLLELERAPESPQNIIGTAFESFLFGAHPYGQRTDGSISSIRRLTVADLKQFYQQYYQPKTAILSIAGDINPTELKRLITKLFESWKPAQKVIPPILPVIPSKEKQNRVLLINKEDALETTIRIGHAGTELFHPERGRIDLVNTLLGGRFTSWLNESLRVNSGLTYGAGSAFQSYSKGGAFYVDTYTETKYTEIVIDSILTILTRLNKQPLTDSMLTSAKNYLAGQYPPQFETNQQLAFEFAHRYYYQKPLADISFYLDQIQKATAVQMEEIKRGYFSTSGLSIVVIGKASEIKSIMEKYGPVTVMEVANLTQ